MDCCKVSKLYRTNSVSGTIADWYNSLNEDGKGALRMTEMQVAMFKNLCMENWI